MNFLLTYPKVNKGNDKNDDEENERTRTRDTEVTSLDVVVDHTDDRVKSAGIVRRSHFLTEYTDDARVFLKSTDKSGDDYVSEHRR